MAAYDGFATAGCRLQALRGGLGRFCDGRGRFSPLPWRLVTVLRRAPVEKASHAAIRERESATPRRKSVPSRHRDPTSHNRNKPPSRPPKRGPASQNRLKPPLQRRGSRNSRPRALAPAREPLSQPSALGVAGRSPALPLARACLLPACALAAAASSPSRPLDLASLQVVRLVFPQVAVEQVGGMAHARLLTNVLGV